MANKYLGMVGGVMNFYCLRPDHTDVLDEHVLRRDYDTLAARQADVERLHAQAYGELEARNDALAARLAEAERLLREGLEYELDPYYSDEYIVRIRAFLAVGSTPETVSAQPTGDK